jgi:hypothetical protein
MSDDRLSQLEARVSEQALQIASLESRLSILDAISSDFTALRSDLSRLAAQVAALSSAASSPGHRLTDAVEQLQADLSELKASSPSRAPGRFDSLIVPEFPTLFNDFAGAAFELLYRGSRDGFGAPEFHARCDGHARTVTLIRTTREFVFGGYTPCKWESGPPLGKFIADDGLRSFLFTVRNPHGTNPRKFPLKADRRSKAIFVDPGCGPTFGGGAEISVVSDCDKKGASSTKGFGNAYTNDTGIDGKAFFTGEPSFVVKEIEIFEVVA